MEEAMNMRMNDDQSISIVHHHGDEVAKEDSTLKTDVYYDSRENYNSEINCSASAIHHIIHHQSQSIFNSLVPIHFHLQIGDILLFNSMIFHYGAKNSSVESRPLLSFSFQNVDSTSKKLVHIDGFTYHSHHTIRNAHLTVIDFPVIS
jgi:acid phosphatase class B